MSVLETIGWILLIAAAIAFIIFWWWLVWVCVGIFMDYFAIPGDWIMQVFLWFVVNMILGVIGKAGMSTLE